MVKIKKQSSKSWDDFIYDTLREIPDSSYTLPAPPEEREVLITKAMIKAMAEDMNYGMPRSGPVEKGGLKAIADKYGLTVSLMRKFADKLRAVVAEINNLEPEEPEEPVV